MPRPGSIPPSTDPLRDKPVVFMSIDERWAEAILEGEKRYEYRRQPPSIDAPYRVVVYASGGPKSIVGGFETHSVLEATIDELVERTVPQTPHEPEDIRDYFEGMETGSAIRVDGYLPYDDPVPITTLQEADPDLTAPQNFRYLRPEQEQDQDVLKKLPYDRGVPFEW
ncbi:ASCH domain protein [Halorhabdus tiamatea SARL4B]|uniref:ASCH domain protein n=1 Tax=Halorhabdus tiamatea SARL4B TaxID=1033806 RepID=U2E6A0_9EURY|nr:ASCH domain-containing protein [Halorhabdus tiamatea]ERJ07426.1 ASCH domain protein [Halorhabdus tiamatea SARL4B]